jgi:hypothetical protein
MTRPNEFDALPDDGMRDHGMHDGRMDDRDRDAQAFDAAARAAHADALTHVSARVQAQLQQRRRAALTGRAPATARSLWPMFALGGAAVIALAIGLRFVREPADAPATPSIASQPSGERANDAASTTTMPDTATAMAPDAIANPSPSTAADSIANPSIDPATRDVIATNDSMHGSTIDATMAEIEAILGDDSTTENPLLAISDDALLAELDENPDLYLWLGSDEGQADTTELL